MFAAVFNFYQLLIVLVLSVCACTYAKDVWPSFAPKGSIRWKLARDVILYYVNYYKNQAKLYLNNRIGERASPAVSIACIGMAYYTIFISD